MIQKTNKKRGETRTIDISKFHIGKIKIDLLVFDRDSAFRARFIEDKRTYGTYLDENGGIRVFRDGVRIYDYGEQGNDWLGLDSRRINAPGGYLSNNLVLGAVRLDREFSSDLQEKANREGFIENAAYMEFRDAVSYAMSDVEIEGKVWTIAFNVNQMFATKTDKLMDDDLLFSLTGSYISYLKQKAAGCVSKQGIETFHKI